MELLKRTDWADTPRTTILNILRDVVRTPTQENAQLVAESLLNRLNPKPLVLVDPRVEQQLKNGGNLLYIWPHYSFWDIPLVNAALHFGDEQPLTRNIVANMPRPFFPAGSIPVEFYRDDIRRGLSSDLSENKIAAWGNRLLSMYLGGGAFRSDEFKHARNQAMINSAAEHIMLGSSDIAIPVSVKEGLTRVLTHRLRGKSYESPMIPNIQLPEGIDLDDIQGGNIALWPSGPNMVGPVRSGGARIIKQMYDHGAQPEVINVHLFTDPRIIFSSMLLSANPNLPSILQTGQIPIVMAAMPGPHNGDLHDILDYDVSTPHQEKVQRARAATRHMANVFRDQLPIVLGAMENNLDSAAFEHHAKQAEKVYPRI